MDKKVLTKAATVIAVIIVVLGLYTLIYNKTCTATMPNIHGMNVRDAINLCDDLRIVNARNQSTYMVKDATTGERITEDFENYFVVDQSTKPDKKFVFRDGIFPKAMSITDLLVLDVCPSLHTLIEYTIPEGYEMHSNVKAGADGPIIDEQMCYGSIDEAIEPSLSIAIENYNNLPTPGTYVSMPDEIKDKTFEKSLTINGNAVYIERVAVEGTSDKTLEAHIRKNGTWIHVMAEEPVNERDEEAFYSLIESIRFKSLGQKSGK